MTTNDQHTDLSHDRGLDPPQNEADLDRPQFGGTADPELSQGDPGRERHAAAEADSNQRLTEPTEQVEQPRQSSSVDAQVEGQTSSDGALFATGDMSGLRSQWDHVQAAFVDDPKACVAQADTLVSEVVDQLTRSFSDTRARLEAQWARGEQASTEDLRVALTQYREFFQRLLAV